MSKEFNWNMCRANKSRNGLTQAMKYLSNLINRFITSVESDEKIKPLNFHKEGAHNYLPLNR